MRNGHDIKVPDSEAIQLANTKIDEIRNGFATGSKRSRLSSGRNSLTSTPQVQLLCASAV